MFRPEARGLNVVLSWLLKVLKSIHSICLVSFTMKFITLTTTLLNDFSHDRFSKAMNLKSDWNSQTWNRPDHSGPRIPELSSIDWKSWTKNSLRKSQMEQKLKYQADPRILFQQHQKKFQLNLNASYQKLFMLLLTKSIKSGIRGSTLDCEVHSVNIDFGLGHIRVEHLVQVGTY